MLRGGCLRDRGRLEEVGPKLNSLDGVPVPIKEEEDEGCPRLSKVAISQGAPILMHGLLSYMDRKAKSVFSNVFAILA